MRGLGTELGSAPMAWQTSLAGVGVSVCVLGGRSGQEDGHLPDVTIGCASSRLLSLPLSDLIPQAGSCLLPLLFGDTTFLSSASRQTPHVTLPTSCLLHPPISCPSPCLASFILELDQGSNKI